MNLISFIAGIVATHVLYGILIAVYTLCENMARQMKVSEEQKSRLEKHRLDAALGEERDQRRREERKAAAQLQ